MSYLPSDVSHRLLATAGIAGVLLACLPVSGCARQRASRTQDESLTATPAPDSQTPSQWSNRQGATEEPVAEPTEETKQTKRRGFFRNWTDYTLQIAGEPVLPGTAVAIDVENAAGLVRVVVDEDLEQAIVTIRPVWSGITGDARPESDISDSVNWGFAEHVASDETRSVLRVIGNPEALASVNPQYAIPRLAIEIRTPAGEGLLVRNGIGAVDVVNVRGAITIENGFGGAEGGPVQVRTDHPIDAPVNITTNYGDVLLAVVSTSQGTVTLEAPDGTKAFNIPGGDVAQVRNDEGVYTAVWNDGGNPIVLRSEHDDVRVIGTRLPSMYTFNEFDPTPWGGALRDKGLPF